MKKCVNCLNNDQHKTHTHTLTLPLSIQTLIHIYIYVYACTDMVQRCWRHMVHGHAHMQNFICAYIGKCM